MVCKTVKSGLGAVKKSGLTGFILSESTAHQFTRRTSGFRYAKYIEADIAVARRTVFKSAASPAIERACLSLSIVLCSRMVVCP